MIINNNISALNTYRQLGVNNNANAKSLEKLSSGLRINKAGDDAAGLAISEKMRGQIRGLDQASRNAQDGVSMIQTAEGALQETQNILQRMRELATQAANDSNVDVDRNEIQKEINQLTSEVNRIGNTTEFNEQVLLDGGKGKDATSTKYSATFQIGANQGQSMTIEILDMRAEALGIAAEATAKGTAHVAGENEKAVAVADASYAVSEGVSDGTDNNSTLVSLDVSSHETATAAIEVYNNAIEAVSAERSKLGAYQNRLDHTIANLGTSSENLQAAESRIRDVDMAKEVMEMTRTNILAQASQAMLAQANQKPQAVLQLLS